MSEDRYKFPQLFLEGTREKILKVLVLSRKMLLLSPKSITNANSCLFPLSEF